MSSPAEPDAAVARFLVRGRVETTPRRRADRDLVLRWLAAQVTVVHEPVGERALTERLAGLVRDPVGARRDLIDAGLLSRTRDGSEYWRTHVTEFDGLDTLDVIDTALADAVRPAPMPADPPAPRQGPLPERGA